jgi:SAM-dependent methyltransferase
MESSYQNDLAYIHDTGYSHIAASAAPLVVNELRSSGHHSGIVVELGCGSGISSLLLRDAGFEIVGIDLSKSMINLARKRVPDAEFRVGSFVAADFPSCAAVTAIGEVLNYGFDAANASEARTKLLERIFAALKPGGLLVFDIATPSRAPASNPQRSFAEGPHWAVLVETEADDAKTFLTRRITTFRKKGESYRRGFEIHSLHLIEPADMMEKLQRLGFSVETIDCYGSQPLPKGDAGFLARKPGPGARSTGKQFG